MSPFAEEIKKQDVVDQLTWDDSVNANEIYVNVQNDTVELRGTVQNFTAKMAAERDAYQVQGVRNVENHLEIDFPPSITLPDDDEITGSIENMLSWNSEINAGEIEVRTKNNVVTLDGQVESYWEKYLAGNYANSTRGVIEVVNNLQVKPARKAVDENIEKDIRNAFKRTFLIDEEKINVEVHNGIVHLSGSVPNFLTKIQANNIAIYTTGVKDVVDEITIS
ncbi:MAG: BON domain-containing protein [Bacteroidales bacterium]